MAVCRWLVVFLGCVVLSPVALAAFFVGSVLSIPALLLTMFLPDPWPERLMHYTPIGLLVEWEERHAR